jgi:hypothetical protein
VPTRRSALPDGPAVLAEVGLQSPRSAPPVAGTTLHKRPRALPRKAADGSLRLRSTGIGCVPSGSLLRRGAGRTKGSRALAHRHSRGPAGTCLRRLPGMKRCAASGRSIGQVQPEGEPT